MSALDFLSELERQEAASLGWGIIDGGFSWNELDNLADTFVQQHNTDSTADQLLDELLRRELLFEFQHLGAPRVRTRMAEGVRLMARLRQLFPYHYPPGQPPRWESAARLVSDYRFFLRPRRYPARHLSITEVLDQLQQAGLSLSDVQHQVMKALVRELSLSTFQVDATQQILQDLAETRGSRATIVSAGTGTGKTLAFYLPALTYLAKVVTEDPRPGLRVLALYPRNELLKDQLGTALERIVHMNRLPVFKKRPLSIGALYGDVPEKASLEQVRRRSAWREIRGEGFICPFLRDPKADSDDPGELVWRNKDIENGIERLFARTHPKRVYGPDVIRLTRKRMREAPPDILFSSVEMLNRSLSSAQNGPLYGLGRGSMTPRLILLDEVHTYEGVTGAQVAYTLRRWKHAVRYKIEPVFVGLSATLASPVTFFSDLTGVPDYRVTSIQASADEAHSQEYLLLLRGDPFSGPSLLSTSIQVAMLLGRLLDPISSTPSQGAFGQRVFLFTDDLDVTNRFYDDLASAEGLMRRGGRYVPNPHKDSLAALRSPLREQDDPNLFLGGQSWRLPERVGHPPTGRLLVDRVSSQDQGVSADAALVVATSSLEVGFDDDRVGAVLQHKSPRSTTSYLQRKGRAGRTQTMRPWTCVVLSAYGRDQVSYQNYENLIDPKVDVKILPLSNRYVLRIQATLACLDWLSQQVQALGGGAMRYADPWKDLCGPTTNDFQDKLRSAYLQIVRQLLQQPNGTRGQSLATHVQSALGISAYETQVLLWEPPRSLFMGVFPTLHRRLQGNWALYGIKEGKERSKTPLPEFMPHALFGDLNLPEVALHLPGEKEPVLESVDSVLRNYAPGRVNRRHATKGARVSHWIPIAYDTVAYELDLASIEAIPSEELGAFSFYSVTGTEESIRVMRPYGFNLAQTPRSVKSQSNARPYWHTQIVAPRIDTLPAPARHKISKASPLARYVEEIAFFTHERGQPITVRRFTDRAEARLYVQEGKASTKEYEVTVSYAQDGQPVALGFLQGVDAIGFAVIMPEAAVLREQVLANPELQRALRTQYLYHVITKTADLVEANVFQRDWLTRLLIAVLIRTAAQSDSTLEEAHAYLLQNDYAQHLQAELTHLADATIDPDTGDVLHGRHGRRLDDLLQDPTFVAELTQHAPLLWESLGPHFETWLLARFRTTLGAALLYTCAAVTPGRTEEGLILDLQSGPPAGDIYLEERDIIWISESTLGGTGHVEAIAQHIRDYPNQFFQLVIHSLEASDLEQVSAELPRLLDRLRVSGSLTEATEHVRAARTNADLQETTEHLRRCLQNEGILCTHSVFSALAVRLLRAGATRSTEVLTITLLDHWDDLEERLGIEVEPRILAEIASGDRGLDKLLPPAPSDVRDNHTWRSNICYSLLWSRGSEVRALSLRPYNPFTDLLPTDRRLVLDGLHMRNQRVSVLETDWREQADDLLRGKGHVDLVAPADQVDDLAAALDTYLFDAVEMGYLHLYPHLTGLHREDSQYRATLVLAEVAPA